MKKKTITTLALPVILLLFAAGLASAEGNAESDNNPGKMIRNQSANLEEITVTGKLIIQDNEWPRLDSNGTLYILRYPYHLNLDLDVKGGDEITVKGYVFSRPARLNQSTQTDKTDTENQKYLRVTQATIKGKEYILPFGGRGPMGPRGGNQGPCNREKGCW